MVGGSGWVGGGGLGGGGGGCGSPSHGGLDSLNGYFSYSDGMTNEL